MSRRGQLLAAGLVLLVAALIYDAWVAAKFGEFRRQAAQRASRYDALIGALGPVARPEGRFAAGPASGGRPGRAAGATAESLSAAPAQATLTPNQLIASDPVLLKRYLDNFRMGLDVQFGLFIHLMGLSPSDADQFKDLMANMEEHNLQMAQAAAREGLDPAAPEMKALRTELNAPTWTALNQLLGPAGMSVLQQYRSDWPTVTVVQNLGGSLPDAALSAGQAQQLVSILSAASERDANGTVMPDTVNVSQALAGAGQVLSSDQMVILSAMLLEAEAKAKIGQLSQSH